MKSCYAINGGNEWRGGHAGPRDIARSATHAWRTPSRTADNGMAFEHQLIGFRDIEDGSSNTIYIGEKSLDPLRYDTWTGSGDSLSMYVGHDPDVARWGGPLIL